MNDYGIIGETTEAKETLQNGLRELTGKCLINGIQISDNAMNSLAWANNYTPILDDIPKKLKEPSGEIDGRNGAYHKNCPEILLFTYHEHFKRERKLTDIRKDLFTLWPDETISGTGEPIQSSQLSKFNSRMKNPKRRKEVEQTYKEKFGKSYQHKDFIIRTDLDKFTKK